MAPTARTDRTHFDRTVLVGLFGDDSVIIASVLRTYQQSTHAALAELRLAVGSGQADLACDIAHRIKGASRMSGALAVGEGADAVECAARARDMEAAAARLGQLEADWRHLSTCLATGEQAGGLRQ